MLCQGVVCVLIAVLGLATADDSCVNYVNGVELVIECTAGCCISNGSFAVNITLQDVCVGAGGNCDSTPSIPTSCPIVVDGERKMYGCGSDEICCHGNLRDIVLFDYQPLDRTDVCSEQGVCNRNGDTDDEDEVDTDDEIDEDGMRCFKCTTLNLVQIMGIDVTESAPKLDESLCSNGLDPVRCDVGLVCYSHKVEIAGKISQGGAEYPIGINITDEGCGSPMYEAYMANACQGLWSQGITIALPEYALALTDLVAKCTQFLICDEDCVDDDSGLTSAWWIILLIILAVLFFVALALFLFAYFYCRQNRAVSPTKDNERNRRLREVSGYLTAAISARDMADLKLIIDIVEKEGFQRPLDGPYRQACALFAELMARDAAVKRRELDEEEKRAARVKQDLADAEAAVLQTRPPLEVTNKAEQEEARLAKEALRARELANSRWRKQWPRLEIMRALNDANQDAINKAVEAARLQRAEDERLAKEAEMVKHCRALLQQGISTGDIGQLEAGIKPTQINHLQGHEELAELYNKAETMLEQKRGERARIAQDEEKRRAKEAFRIGEEKREAEAKRLAALSRLEEIRSALKAGVSLRSIPMLQSAMKLVEDNSLLQDLPVEYKEAAEMLARLEKMEVVKRKIQEMDRPLIAELKSFSEPPIPVLRAMVGSYLLMGESVSDLKEWSNIVILLGKTGKKSVKRRVQELQLEDVSEDVAHRVRKEIMGLTSEEVYEANQAASLFFDWTEMICFEKKCLSESTTVTDV